MNHLAELDSELVYAVHSYDVIDRAGHLHVDRAEGPPRAETIARRSCRRLLQLTTTCGLPPTPECKNKLHHRVAIVEDSPNRLIFKR
jgi:hypothetical protein